MKEWGIWRRIVLVAALGLVGGWVPLTAADVAAQKNDRETLRAVSLLFRHSVISPKYQLPKAKTEWPMGFRQLTAVGIHHMFRSGQALRQKYVEELGLLAGRYKMSQVYVRASNTDRALQSAQMLVLGLYPLGTGPNPASYDKALAPVPGPGMAFTPVPIHSVALDDDSVMRPWTGQAACRKYRTFVKSLRKTRTYKAQAKKFKNFLLRMAAATGINEGKSAARMLYDVNEIYEPLSALVQHNLPLPKAINDADMEVLRALSDWNYHHQFLGKDVGRLTGGPFVGEVLRNFRTYIDKKGRSRRFFLYSGHQRTILGVEAALGIETARTSGPFFLGRVPPLGSHYAFELHEPEGGEYAVRVKFVDGKTEQTVRIPGCPADMCPFAKFREITAAVVPKDWRAECNS